MTPIRPVHDRRTSLALAAALAAVAVATFIPTVFNDFVNYDDTLYVSENPRVQRGLTWEGLRWALDFDSSRTTGNWHPITWLSLMLDAQLWGTGPAGFHLVNALIHGVNAALLFLVLRTATADVWRSALVAGLWAVHPLRVESVAWVSERKDVLAAFFGLLAIRAYLAGSKPGERAGVTKGVLLRTTIWMTLSLMCKPMLVTLPALLILLDHWPLRRVALSAGALARLTIEKWPMWAMSAAFSAIAILAQDRSGAIAPLEALPIEVRLGNAMTSYLSYVDKTLRFQNMAVYYPYFVEIHWGSAMAAGAALAAITAACLAMGRARPWLPVGWLWFLGLMAPVIGLVQVGEQSMADRYTYLPTIGLLVMLMWSIPEARRRIALAAGAAAAVVLVAFTQFQITTWRDTMTLFEHASKVVPNNALALNNIGVILEKQGRYDQALAQYRKGLEAHPRYAMLWNNAGSVLNSMGRKQQAIESFEKALSIAPDYSTPVYNIATVLQSIDQHEQAVAAYERVIAMDPTMPGAHYGLGQSLTALGRKEQATQAYRRAIDVDAMDYMAMNNLAIALHESGRADEAEAWYRRALRIKPDFAQAMSNLGLIAEEARGDLAEAERLYRRAIAADARCVEAHLGLGIVLGKTGRRPEAVAALQQALQLQPGHAQAKSELDKLLKGGG